MSSVVISGNTSGAITLSAPDVAGTNTITLPASTGYLFVTPSAGTLGVDAGGTGITTTTAYGVLAGGTTSTGAFQNIGTGTSGQILTSNGPGVLPSFQSAAPSYAGPTVQTFTSPGTFTIPPGITKLKVTCIGGGGGGGPGFPGSNSPGHSGGGGGGGGVNIQWFSGLTSGGTIPYSVGSGGGASASGGTTSFGPAGGTTITATGGGGGGSCPGSGQTGAHGSGGTGGNYGYPGASGSGSAGSAGQGGASLSQTGTISLYGQRGGTGNNGGGAGVAGVSGGGGGGSWFNNAGASGGTGLIIVEY